MARFYTMKEFIQVQLSVSCLSLWVHCPSVCFCTPLYKAVGSGLSPFLTWLCQKVNEYLIFKPSKKPLVVHILILKTPSSMYLKKKLAAAAFMC